MSGQGDSEDRESYHMNINALEVIEVARALQTVHGLEKLSLLDKPVVIGHSFGGWITMLCGRDYGKELGGIIVLDSSVRPPNHPNNLRGPPMKRKKPGTKTREELRKRFRLMPPQPVTNKYLLDYIFPLSVRETDEGVVVWKDDPNRFQKNSDYNPNYTQQEAIAMDARMSQRLRGIQCRMTLMWGEHSEFFQDPAVLEYMRREVEAYSPGGHAHTPIIMIPDAHHHVMFDQPLVVVTSLQAVLSGWYAADEQERWSRSLPMSKM